MAMAEQTLEGLTGNQLAERWGQRTWSALMVVFTRNISPCCQRFAHFYHVASTTATGNLDEEGILRSARSLHTAAAMYASEHADATKETKRKAQGKGVPVRRARLVPQNWEPCWQELRTLDKWSGAAANPDVERAFLEGLVSDEDGDDEDVDEEGDTEDTLAEAGDRRGRRARGPALLDRPPLRQEALKRRLADEKADAAALAACNKSMGVVAVSLARRNELGEEAQRLEKQRMALDFFNRPENKHTPEGVAFQAKMLAQMAKFGDAACGAGGEPTGGTATQASDSGNSDAYEIEGDTREEAAVPTGAPPAPAPSSLAHGEANRARGAKAMAAKAARAHAAVHAAATIDLTKTPAASGQAAGAVAAAAAAVPATRRADVLTPEEDGGRSASESVYTTLTEEADGDDQE